MMQYSLDALRIDKNILSFLKTQKNNIIIDKYSDKGGNGELFFGENKILKKRVALKFYPFTYQDILHEEPRILSKIKDKNILEVLDAGIISKEYAYFMTPEINGGI